MRAIALEPSSADAVVFTLVAIASTQALVWWREREPGTLGFTAAALATALLALGDLAAWPGLPDPVFWPLLALSRLVQTVGLLRHLGGPARRWPLPALALPLVLAGLLAAFGPPAAVAALFCAADVIAAALCLAAARREPGAAHGLLALGSLLGVAALALAFVRGVDPVPLRQHYAWPQAIGLGIVLQVASLLRRSRNVQLAQAHAQRMSNFYAALSQTNQALLRVREAEALYAEICRICVDAGHARVACVYLDGGDVALRVATAGPAAEFLAGVPARWDITTPEARASFTVQAMREGVRLVANDYPSELRSGPWRDQALKHGVHAIAWLPLRRGEHKVGVLMLAAPEKDFFDEPLMQLLGEMTADISFALDNIDREVERRASLQEVQAGLERFSRLFETAPAASAIVSLADRRVMAVNAAMCERYNAPREQLVGRMTSALGRGVVAADRARFYDVLERDGHVRNLVLQMADETGALHPELVNAEPIEYLGQACILVMQLDITDLQAAAQARQALATAQAASQAKTEFLSRMSHELRTPLNAVLGFTALLRNGAGDRLTAAERAQLDHVQRAGWHLLTLINDVLDISRIEAGRFGVEARRLRLQPLLDEVLQLSVPLAGQHDVSLQSAGGSDAVFVVADPTRLRQVLLNLLSNAIKYNRRGGEVRVQARREGERVVVEVADSGLGMTTQQLEHLFEPFNRLGREREGIEGTGIGLALTQQLVHLMGGEVQVESASGRGTVVHLRLPACDGAEAVPATPVRALPATSPRGTVLYIEDNAVNTLLVEQLLSRWEGVAFASAEDARSGLERVAALRPDVVLLDLQLPDGDGLEVLRRLRADPASAQLPVIVLSASAMPDDIERARAAGASDYWTKPLDFEQVLAGIAQRLPRDRAAAAAEPAPRTDNAGGGR